MDDLVLVEKAPLPKNWEHQFGYPQGLGVRWIAVYWDHNTDTPMYDNGMRSDTADWERYDHLIRKYPVDITAALLDCGLPGIKQGAAIHALGSSRDKATHRLVLDLQERKIYVASAKSAKNFLAAQWPEPEALPQLTHPDEIKEWLESALVNTGLTCTCNQGWVETPSGFERCPRFCNNGIIQP